LPLASVFGLFVSRFPTPPAPGVSTRLLTFGVPFAAWNGCPEVFAAFG